MATPAAIAGRAAALLAASALAAGCARGDERRAGTCAADAPALLAALERAPDAVAPAGGARLSRCVASARNEGELRALGVALTGAADALRGRARHEPVAALRLGYLAGAVRAGADAGGGVADQLARRVEQLAALEHADADARAALARGRRAGLRSG